MEYEIVFIERHGRKTPKLVFSDPEFALAGEMLLAERSFMKQIIETLSEALNGKNAPCSLNIFSIEAEPETTLVRDDYSLRSVNIKTELLYRAAKDYSDKLSELKKRKKSRADQTHTILN